MGIEKQNTKAAGLATLALCVGAALSLLAAPRAAQAQESGAQQPAAKVPTAAERFKNIQVLKDIPADELLPSMRFMAGSLGVKCAFCHVNPFEKDAKPEKATARKMIAMMMAINKDNFEERREVTCYTCHQGSTKPMAIPVIPEAGVSSAPAPAAAVSASAALPTADELVDKYTQAIGGAEPIGKLTSRVTKGSLEGEGFRGEIEETFKAPNKSFSIFHSQQGDFTDGYDGTVAWAMGPQGHVREQTGAELAEEKRFSDFFHTLDIKKSYGQLQVRGKESAGGHDAYVVVARAADGTGRARLLFDAESGLLLRLVEYESTPLGLLPTQTDYSDYRDAGGVRVPFVVRTASPGNNFLYQYREIALNVPVDDKKFAKPAEKAPATPANPVKP